MTPTSSTRDLEHGPCLCAFGRAVGRTPASAWRAWPTIFATRLRYFVRMTAQEKQYGMIRS
jgi:hypothetical protein